MILPGRTELDEDEGWFERRRCGLLWAWLNLAWKGYFEMGHGLMGLDVNRVACWVGIASQRWGVA